MSVKQTTKHKKEKKKNKFFSFFTKNKMLLAIISLIVIFGAGIFLIVNGFIQYEKTTRETYIVAGMKSMEEGNFHKAQSFFLKAAYMKVPEAYPYLAWISAKSGNFTKALEYCRECAKHDDIYGGYEIMGYLALLGYGNAQGAGSAIFYFDEAMKGYSEEYLKTHNPRLNMYEKSIDLCMNKLDYIRMVDEATKQGSILGILLRGDIDFLGEDHDYSPNSAAKSWEDAKNNGLIEAQSRLAGLIWYGYGKRRDYKTAMRLFEDAAKKHDPVANYSLGLIRLRQQKSTSFAEGMRYMKNAAKMNYGPALTAVGVTAICNSDDFTKISHAAADIFKQAYDCGDSTGGILYSLMLMNGYGVPKDTTEAFSILYDLKNRGITAVSSMLKYFTYNNNQNGEVLFEQAVNLCYLQYLGEYTFSVGAPEAVMYHVHKENNTLNYYVSQKEDRERYTDEFINDLGKNYVEKLDLPNEVFIKGKPLLYPEITQILEMYNPTTGARAYMPQLILDVNASIPRLPKDYDKFNIDFNEISSKFE